MIDTICKVKLLLGGVFRVTAKFQTFGAEILHLRKEEKS